MFVGFLLALVLYVEFVEVVAPPEAWQQNCGAGLV